MAAAGCFCMASREAARKITRLYDSWMQESGIRITQFTILSQLMLRGEMPPEFNAALYRWEQHYFFENCLGRFFHLDQRFSKEQVSLYDEALLVQDITNYKLGPHTDKPSKVITFDFSGHTGPQGDFGHFHFAIKEASAPLDAHVDLDCVNVFPFPSLGAGGWMGGVVTKVTPEPNVYGISPGDQLLFGINDFGRPSDPTRDQLDGYYGFPQACKAFGPSTQTPIDQGNINIRTD